MAMTSWFLPGNSATFTFAALTQLSRNTFAIIFLVKITARMPLDIKMKKKYFVKLNMYF